MGLKKYSDFTTNDHSVDQPKSKKSLVDVAKSIVKPKPKKRDNMDPHVSRKKPKLNFNGRVVKFPNNFKPSSAYSMLESNNISKDKLYFMIIEQSDNSLLVVKYNEQNDLKTKEFVQNLINYYKSNKQLYKLFDNIIVEGTDSFSLIKNIPDVDLDGKKLTQILNDDLMNLLKNIK